MKKILLLMLSLVMVTTMMAEGVTPDEALNQARNFVKNRENKGMRPHRAPGTAASRLVMAKQVNGLYVFNVAKDEGFVIVSNDDRTEPILGYSDNGHFDPENMPENMRAWLQGYADQIAWLNEHGDEESAVATMPSLTSTHVKQPIAPLMTTLWNQDEPYDKQTPYFKDNNNNNYSYSTTAADGYEHCATGCVATAMAQVMKFNRWPEGNSSAIPSYTWKNANVSLAGLPATTFDWNNMIDNYKNGYTTAEGAAVAKLMRYCGQSVNMNYGPQSGANTAKVADALKDYFDYSSTTTYKDRSFYTYAGWIELLYNELAQGRPMVFSGQSTGGGHAFVCDGYQSEDYFHINWGWGGRSDGYFKLSVMNPKEQGIGGSSSDDGFHFGQGAIVGIQKNGGTGTVLDVPTSNFSLSLQGIDFSKNPVALGETVEVTFKIKNDGPDEYSGDIWVYVPQLEDVLGSGLMAGKTFTIPAGETKDCVIPYTPKDYYGTFSIQAYRPTGGGYYNRIIGNISKTLTVTQGSGGSNNVTLTVSDPVVENTTSRGNSFNLYGNQFNATVRVSNETGTDYDGDFIWLFYPAGATSAAVNTIPMNVPANSYVDMEVSVKNLDYSNTYYGFRPGYIQNNTRAWSNTQFYYMNGGIIAYSENGESTVKIPSGTSFNAATDAPEALAVNVSGTGITSITPNSLANTVYIYSGTKPSGLDGKNVVKYDNGNYTAESITLTDNNGFYSPVDFTADKVEFNYDFTVAADGTNGWNTLILPFNVTSVTADDAAIDWFHSSSDKGKNFWVKAFDSDEATQVYFDFVDEIKANTPYIVAFPGNKWGKKWDMSNKALKFIGENVTVSNSEAVKSVTGSAYRFVGNTVQDNTANIYSLNGQGNLFVLNQSAGSAPFRAFFKPGTFDISVTSLSLGSVTGGTTSIDDLPATLDQETGAWYSIDGRRLNGQPTQKGVYIKNGKKTIIK